MVILHKLCLFKMPVCELVTIYILYLRSILEQSCQVWHFAISDEENGELERVQKVACKVILDSEYTDYETALEVLNLEKLCDRRDQLCLRFAKKSLKFDQTKDMFPLNPPNQCNTRDSEKFRVKFARTDRLLNSSIPQLQRLLNEDARSK